MTAAVLSPQRGLNDYFFGFLCSLLGHAALLYAIFFLLVPSASKFSEPVIYSVSLEGGKTLGGISQAPDESKKQPVAPPKVSGSEPPPEKVEQTSVSADKSKEAPVDDAEVSLADKAEIEKKEREEKKKLEEEKRKKAAEEKKRKEEEEKKKQEEAKKKTPSSADLDKQYKQAMQRYLGESAAAGGKGFGAAKLGGSGFGGGIVRPAAWIRYKNILESHVKRGWNWFDQRADLRADVTFRIARDGRLSDVAIEHSSGNSKFDESVRRAVLKASPVPPPPEEYYEDFQFVSMDFKPSE